MTVWFVSRHPGAQAWAKAQALSFDRLCPHLDPDEVTEGDVVIGSLPVNLASEVCQRGAKFINLSLKVPPHLRGQELTIDQMLACDVKLEQFDIRPVGKLESHQSYLQQSVDFLSALTIQVIEADLNNRSLRPPQNIGSAWHGAFGKVLHDEFPEAYAALYGEQTRNYARPYVLRAPFYDDSITEGSGLTLKLILANTGINHLRASCAALMRMAEIGVGPGLGKFEVRHLRVQPFQLPEVAKLPAHRDICLALSTPVLLKEDNTHMKQAPSMLQLMKRILARTQSLWPDHPMPIGLQQALLRKAATICGTASQIRWESQPRYSARQKTWMPFGGLTGLLEFKAVPAEIQLWLHWAEILHIGNKTTFGQGQLSITERI